MKKLINDPQTLIADALIGVEAAHSDLLRVDHQHRVVLRRTPKDPRTVAIVSGGGAGHEPLHAGYVGTGMLDAAVVGQVFTSPTPDQIVAATTAVDTGAGVLHLIKNYSGDVMNFEMAAELVAAETAIEVAAVVIDDDVAVQDSTYTAGRRGVGLTVLVERLVGAAAEQGHDLAEVTALASRLVADGRSIGLATAPCTVPAAGRPTFDLADGQIEFGIGIHGEPGRERRPISSARELADDLVEAILADHNLSNRPVFAMLNGMGATPLIELQVMYGQVHAALARRGITVVRNLVGNYITSLEMAGCSLSLLGADDELVSLWDSPVNTPALRWAC